ncbi:hypothetical protein LTR37_019578 [Vermiconidia calcicola]|uniref:Uncharacterized protein n=1 Tax=Vermiconidia calcicola TaxID=1690605 RepID=A0ACC3MDV5_9PEZI|nr:hypothetical protein LTR37_019578 [Vermiconidia calcicola]
MAPRKSLSSFSMRLLIIVASIGAGLVLIATWAEYAEWPIPFTGQLAWRKASHSSKNNATSSSIEQLALQKVLQDASPIFGRYENVQNGTATWMAKYPDDTKIVHMNIPGTHDAATWHYTRETQRRMQHITHLVNDGLDEIDPDHYRCQDKSMLDMLNAGIRAFDLRYASDITNTTIVFWHGPALQSQTATVEDVLFGFYRWLDDHPTEALFLSFQYEPAAALGNVNSIDEQLMLYQALTTPAAKKYILQTRGQFGTLGEARSRITLLRRFDLDLDLVPPAYETSIPGVHFSPREWTRNGANITLRYNDSNTISSDDNTAYIQDYYRPVTPANSTLEENIDAKLDATITHLRMAASSSHPDALFWGFASCTNTGHELPKTPRALALGTSETKDRGVNDRLEEYLERAKVKGSRLGIVMFDFFAVPEGLVETLLGVRAP